MGKRLTDSEQPVAVEQHYGRIRSAVYHYITPAMIVSVTVMITLVTLGFDKISAYFMHGPVLNGLMLVVITTGISMAFHNNFSIFRAAQLLKQIEILRDRGNATAQEVHKLRRALERKAHLLSMASFSLALEKMQGTGNFTLSDPDARMIKSKFGSRVNHMRGKVNYFCGILVMLGLIGTFWGLLGTITSVGQAMTKISDNFAAQTASGASANIDMGGFLQSISKPLEGMGVGFSASLFGLTGSLFLGFFNFLCGHAQNRFIEHFARWIDDCIPSVSQSLMEKVKDGKVPGTDELKSWLAGFIYLSNKTNQQIAELIGSLAASNQTGAAALAETQKLYTNQHRMLKMMEALSGGLKGLQTNIHSLGTDVKNTALALKKLPDQAAQLTELMGNGMRAQQRSTDAQFQQLGQLFTRIESHSSSLAKAADAQTILLREAHHPALPPASTGETDVARLAASVTALIGEMKHKNDEALLNVFLRNGEAHDGSIDGLFGSPN